MIPAYQLNNIEYRYGKSLALSLDHLSIAANKITALIGPNGCGKSTLLHLLAFLQPTQQGSIKYFSQIATPNNTATFINRIALLPQKPYMLRGTVSDNLDLALKFQQIKKQRTEIKNKVLNTLNISHLEQLQAKKLSGGEQQKVALARALISNPDVLLLDEPFNNLDHSSDFLLQQLLQELIEKQNKTVIFSTHNRLQGIAMADDIISLVKGKSVQTPLINFFQGNANSNVFDTGKIKITLVDATKNHHVSIDPKEIVLSRAPLDSSMRNHYSGKVTAISEETGAVRVTILAGEIFQVLITQNALKQLNISLGDQLWVHFKSNSIVTF